LTRVAESMVLGWSWIRKNTRSRIFFIRKNGTISFETFIETEDSYCIPRFPLTASCHKIADTRTSFTLCQGVGNFTFDSATLLLRVPSTFHLYRWQTW